MSDRGEEQRARKRKLEEISHLAVLSSVAELITKVRNESVQRTNGECMYR